MTDIVRSVEGDTVEIIVFRHYGSQSGKLLDEVFYTEGNETLPRDGIFLEPGTLVHLPVIDEDANTKQLKRLQNLWE